MNQNEINKFCEELESKGFDIQHAGHSNVSVKLGVRKFYIPYTTDLMSGLCRAIAEEAYLQGCGDGQVTKALEIRSALLIEDES